MFKNSMGEFFVWKLIRVFQKWTWQILGVSSHIRIFRLVLARSLANVRLILHKLRSVIRVLRWNTEPKFIVIDPRYRWLWFKIYMARISMIQSIVRKKLVFLERLSLRFLLSRWSVDLCSLFNKWHRGIHFLGAWLFIFELESCFPKRSIDAFKKSWLHFHFMDLLVAGIVKSSEFLKWIYATTSYLQSLRASCWYIRPNTFRLIILSSTRLCRLSGFDIRLFGILTSRSDILRENELIIQFLLFFIRARWRICQWTGRSIIFFAFNQITWKRRRVDRLLRPFFVGLFSGLSSYFESWCRFFILVCFMNLVCDHINLTDF